MTVKPGEAGWVKPFWAWRLALNHARGCLGAEESPVFRAREDKGVRASCLHSQLCCWRWIALVDSQLCPW